jgi:hypothetical protein
MQRFLCGKVDLHLGSPVLSMAATTSSHLFPKQTMGNDILRRLLHSCMLPQAQRSSKHLHKAVSCLLTAE